MVETNTSANVLITETSIKNTTDSIIFRCETVTDLSKQNKKCVGLRFCECFTNASIVRGTWQPNVPSEKKLAYFKGVLYLNEQHTGGILSKKINN